MIDLTTLNTCFINATLKLCGQVYPEFFHAPSQEEEFNQPQETRPEDSENKPTLH